MYQPPAGAALSPRELEVLKYMCAGLKPQEIAQTIGLSVKSVSTYRGRLLKKAGCKTDAQLGVWAERNGITVDNLRSVSISSLSTVTNQTTIAAS